MSMTADYKTVTIDDFETVFIPAFEAYFSGQPDQLVALARDRQLVTEDEITRLMEVYDPANNWLHQIREVRESLRPADYSLYMYCMLKLTQPIPGDAEVSTVYVDDFLADARQSSDANVQHIAAILSNIGDGPGNMVDYLAEPYFYTGYLTVTSMTELLALIAAGSFEGYQAKLMAEVQRACEYALAQQKPLIVECFL